MATYSDRDYFDDKFAEIDRRFMILEVKLDKIHHCMYGNGSVGLAEEVRQVKARLRMAFAVIIGLLPIQIKESRDAIIGILKEIIGL